MVWNFSLRFGFYVVQSPSEQPTNYTSIIDTWLFILPLRMSLGVRGTTFWVISDPIGTLIMQVAWIHFSALKSNLWCIQRAYSLPDLVKSEHYGSSATRNMAPMNVMNVEYSV